MKFELFITLFLINIIACNNLKLTHYNDIPKESQQLVDIKSIDIGNHQIQERAVYSIKSDELKELLSQNEFSLVMFHNSLCSDLNTNLEEFTNELDKELPFYFIALDDWIKYFNYKKLLDYYPNLNKIYMMDNEQYGGIDHWHENGILNKKYRKFIRELVRNSSEYYKTNNLKYDPNYLIIDNNLNIKWSYESFRCDSLGCKNEIDSVLNEINQIFKN